MFRITIKQDIRKDAWNWWSACNKVSYGEDWKQRIEKKLQKNIVSKTQKQACDFLIPYLKNVYKKEHLGQKRREIQKMFNQKQMEIFSRMEKVTSKKIYRDSFICFLTTFPRAPYSYRRGYVWLPIIWPDETYIRTFVHELLHFQTYTYWQTKCLKKLTTEEFENLKEALTVVLNAEFMDLMVWPDKGYAMHKDLRERLLQFWLTNKSFDALVNYGITIYPECKFVKNG